MAEIHKIYMEKDAFDEMLKNLQSEPVFINTAPKDEKVSKNLISSENPNVEELQARVKSLKTRFENFKIAQKKLGIEKISFDYQSFDKQLENLNPTQKDFKNLIENAEKTMQQLESDVNLINGFINPKEVGPNEMKDYIKQVFSALDNDTKKQVKALVVKQIKQIEK